MSKTMTNVRASFDTILYGATVFFVVLLFTMVVVSRDTNAETAVAPCILALGTSAKSVDVSGSAKITTSGCALTVLSSASPAVSVAGSAKITAGKVCAKSALVTGSSKITPVAEASCANAIDPFATELEPSVGACTFTNLSYTNSSSNTLHPGVYCGNTLLAGSTKNTLAPGVYIIKNGTFKVDGSAQVSGTGVVLFFTGTGSALSVGGSAKVALTAPTSGTLAGFAIYLDPAAPAGATSNVSGSAQLSLSGITYLPTQKLLIDGSAKIAASTLTTFIIKTLQVSGSASLSAAGTLPSGPTPDITPPVIAPHDDVLAIGTATGATVSYIIPTSTDDISGSVPVTCAPVSGTIFPLGTTVVTCNAHDAAGNNATPSTFNVIVSLPPDTHAPVIAAHPDVTVAGNLSGVVVTYTKPLATDDIDSAVTVSCTPASGSLFAFGSTTVACTAHDTAGNNAIPTSFDVLVTDQVAPVIGSHSNISVIGTSLGAVVSYTNPTATDNVDATVLVSCLPASGSTFAAGTTTVFCSAHDAAGNIAAATTFEVEVVVPPPTPFTLSTQADESYLCPTDWENCFTGGAGQIVINLGQGSAMGAGTLLSVTIAKDEHSPFVNQPWIFQIECYTNNTYTVTCPDWVTPNGWNGNRPYLVTESSTTTTDGKHWTAYFTTGNESNFGSNTSPVIINPNYFYRLIINDNGWNIGAYGTPTSTIPMLPYYVVTGMTL